MTLPLLPVRFRGWSRLHSGMLPQAQTMPRRWNKRLPLMWALYVFRMNMLLHLQRSRGDQSMRVRMRMMKGTREKLTWSHPKSLLNTWPSRPSHPNPWIRNPQLWLCEMFVPVIMVLLYVDNGLSVGLRSRHLTNRAMLKQTLLTGKPKVTRKEACDKMRSSRQAGRKALPKEKWTAVMAASAGQHPNLLRLEGETLCLHAQVIPDTSDGKVRYHNDLMKACGLTLRELIAAMNKTTEASEKSEQDRRAKRTRNEWHRAAVPAARHEDYKGRKWNWRQEHKWSNVIWISRFMSKKPLARTALSWPGQASSGRVGCALLWHDLYS